MATVNLASLPTVRMLAVRGIITNEDGSVSIQYAEGVPPINPGVDGEYVYPGLTFVQDAVKELVGSFTSEQLLLLHLAVSWLKQDGTFGPIAQVLNKELTLDPAAQLPVKVV